jgi:oligopeptide/dipeptide ABC transporter ATP-binding protein
MPQIHTQTDIVARPPTPTVSDPILEVKNLEVSFFLDEGVVKAVDDVSLTLEKGSTLGLVGESGCGKSVTARAILQVISGRGKVVGGQILYDDGDHVVDIAELNPRGAEIRRLRGSEIAMVFQEPMAAFSPVYTVGRQIGEAIRLHTNLSKADARSRSVELLDKVGIPQPARVVDRYPFELSGGMLQRAMVAMALSGNPRILIADEPTTALDVTVQAQILALLQSIQEETGMSILIISHNMGVIAEVADHVAVMYLGRVVEEAPLWDLFDNAQHPYTRALLRSIPLVTADVDARLTSIEGNVPSPYEIPSGCRFHPRCQVFISGTCELVDPRLVHVNPAHRAACVRVEEAPNGD